ncbi:MAG: PIN domain-containing protein [Thiocapsa sp.]|uniref:type II toxin-antitoxin system VapC family toxin n=1 Tax=Thiocapsa sp. TaxID=2024551 RepID=UPI001BD06118|nr:PIN domain-containing protein [Thiocapsa sp.]QVL50198.1 MAG: PIN domain-containing protein [Thiocapsa sp.]
MRLYLDLCCFNRPYDDQTQTRIRLETEAKILIQEKVKRSECDLVWSSTLDFENANNPYDEHRLAIQQWRSLACTIVIADSAIIAKAQELSLRGLGRYDALHVASAMAGGADLFVTTDDRILKKMSPSEVLKVIPPGEALAMLEHWYDNGN